LRRQAALVDITAHDAVGTGIHIQPEGGERIILRIDAGIDTVILEKRVIRDLVLVVLGIGRDSGYRGCQASGQPVGAGG
jgi:hypothetical protein